ncbi:hypothetical protein DNA98_03300 [Meiothermus sp. Pnk-1]|nr:hypothetical protein DNA98_03300 [Meiothermus sp. Pnk-1]
MLPLQGPWAWLALGLAAGLGLLVVVWLFTTLWLLTLIGGLVGLGALGWQRVRLRLGGGWRRIRRRRLSPPRG